MQARRRLFTQRDCLCEVAQWHSADLRMPALYKLLAGEHRRTPAIAVIADLQEAATLLVVQRSHGEVIDQQHIGARDALQQPAQTAVGPRLGQVAETAPGASQSSSVESLISRGRRLKSSSERLYSSTGTSRNTDYQLQIDRTGTAKPIVLKPKVSGAGPFRFAGGYDIVRLAEAEIPSRRPWIHQPQP
jgi:hypothetical protein